MGWCFSVPASPFSSLLSLFVRANCVRDSSIEGRVTGELQMRQKMIRLGLVVLVGVVIGVLIFINQVAPVTQCPPNTLINETGWSCPTSLPTGRSELAA